jgi:hypothetical protein
MSSLGVMNAMKNPTLLRHIFGRLRPEELMQLLSKLIVPIQSVVDLCTYSRHNVGSLNVKFTIYNPM